MSAAAPPHKINLLLDHACEGGGILCGELPAQCLNEEAAECYRIIVVPENHSCVQINWRDRNKEKRGNITIRGQSVIFVAAQTSYEAILKQETILLRLCLASDVTEWWQNQQTPSLDRVEHYRLWELARRDVSIVDMIRRFVESSCLRNPVFPESYFRHLGTTLAFQLIDALKREREQKAAPTTMDAARLNRVLNYIEANISGKIPIETLANIACLSLTHFKRLFKASTGMSGRNYISKERIRRAQALLRRGGMRVAEVAALSGFCDQSHLDRAFRRFCQCTPKEFLRDGPLVLKNGPLVQSKQK